MLTKDKEPQDPIDARNQREKLKDTSNYTHILHTTWKIQRQGKDNLQKQNMGKVEVSHWYKNNHYVQTHNRRPKHNQKSTKTKTEAKLAAFYDWLINAMIKLIQEINLKNNWATYTTRPRKKWV